MDSGPYPLYLYNDPNLHIRQSQFAVRLQTPSLKEGK